MIDISSTLLWCAFQTTLLSSLTLLLGARPWRIGGSTAPLFGLIGVFLLTGLAFLPIPWSWDVHWFDRQSGPVTATSGETSLVASTQGSVPSLDEKRVPISEPLDFGSTFVEGLLEQLRYSPEPTKANWPLSPVSMMVLTLFATGIMLGSLRFLVGLIATHRMVRASTPIHDVRLDEGAIVLRAKLGLKQPVMIFQTDHLSTAATLGAWRPLILLPAHWRKWTDAELHAVLAHEFAHIVHCDFAAVMISQLSIVIHFYHPLVHWLSSRLRLEQELAADSVAAQVAGGQVRYLKVLAKLALEHQDRFVGWPARAFLPTRHTFLRRLEMLRDLQLNPSGPAPIGRWFAMAAIGLAAFALVGLKPPQSPAMAQEAKVVAKSSASSVPYDLRYFSDEGGIVIAARPAELFLRDDLAEVAMQIQELPQVTSMTASLGMELEDIEQVLVAMGSAAYMPTSLYVRASKPLGDLKSFPSTSPLRLAGADVLSVLSGKFCIWKPDDRSVVLSSKRNVERWIQGRAVERKLTDSEMWKTLKDLPLLAMCEGRVTRDWLRGAPSGNGPAAMMTSSFSPILDEAEFLGAAVSTDNGWSLLALAKSTDSKGAAIIQETSQTGADLIKNGLREFEHSLSLQPETPILPTDSKQAMEALLSAGFKLAERVKIQLDGETVSVKTSIKLDEIPVALIANAILRTRQAVERSQSANNLKQIALAFHNFESAYLQFPSSTTSPNPEHKHLVSWRVMILPFIEQNELYQAYRFDEPWDGPNNIKLLTMIPQIYKHPESAPKSTETNYVILVGDETIFPPNKTSKIAEIYDGTSNTIMVVETKKSIPWTKPEDVEYSKDKPSPSIGGFSDAGFNAAFADGSVRFLSKNIQETMMRAMITARGGEEISN